MQKNKIKILSTRLLGNEFIHDAELKSIDIEVLPFIKVDLIKSSELKNKLRGYLQQTITAVFTSRHAIQAFDQIVNHALPWKVYCIGKATKKAAIKIFEEEVIMGTADNASDLADEIIKTYNGEKIIFFCGNIHRDELPQKLKSNHIHAEEIIVYETTETPHKISKHYDAILFFSPSAVKSFFQLNTIDDKTKIFATGNTTADEVRKHIKHDPLVAESPSEESMVHALIEHFTTKKHLEDAVKK